MVLLMGGCSVTPEPNEPTPAFTTEEEAFAAAEETYRAYVDALNQVDLSDPETFEPVFALTTGELNESDRTNFSAWHADGYSLSGQSFVELIETISTDLPEGGREAKIGACYNVEDVNVLDDAGRSVVEASRPAMQRLEVTLVRGPAAQGLQISSIHPRVELVC
ncbi:hypothetical protein DEU34_3145 [Microbacterium sp. AG1240]|nr:hypothetical protein DEU34_3145 [Microbacterium sp. AG1240]